MAAAGVAKGDRVMSVDGKPIHDLERKAAAMAMKEALESSACQRLTLVIARKCRPDVRAAQYRDLIQSSFYRQHACVCTVGACMAT